MAFDPHPDANQISALLGGELQGTARRELIAHLSRCSSCRQWASYTQTAGGTAGWAPAPSPRPAMWPRYATRYAIRYAIPAAAAVALAGALWWRPVPIATQASPMAASTVTAAVPSPPAATALSAAVATPVAAPTPAANPVAAATAVLILPPRPQPAVPTMADMPSRSTPPKGEFRPSIDFSPLMTGFQDQRPIATADIQDAAQYLPWTAVTPTPAAFTQVAPVAAVMTSPFGPAPTARPARHLSGPYAPRPTPMPDAALGWTVSRGGAVLHAVAAGVWAAVPLVPGLRVRAVYAAGADIWAGADAAQLFVSRDRGTHWRHVTLPEPHPKQAMIDSIEFGDAHHGTVTLDNGHQWVTPDGGASWSRLQ